MAKRIPVQSLTRRERAILRILIREYVDAGKPVGSRRLAKLDPDGMSPATIRNVVADLEDRGFLYQPHTSAGRVPTVKGYQFFVDSLSESSGLSDEDLARIRHSLESETDPAELMNKASRVLSLFSSNLGFVLAPPLSKTIVKRLEFVKITGKRILVILVTQNGLVQHRTVRIQDELPQTELDQAARYLVTHFSGKTLTDIRDELLIMMSEEKALYDRLLKNVIMLGSAGLMAQDESEDETEVFFGGTSEIIRHPDMSDVKRMAVLFRTFEEKSRLVEIIGECLRSESDGPRVTIGLDDLVPGMKDWTIISSPFRYGGVSSRGGLGIIGPSRMEYDRAITLVDYVAKLFGQLTSRLPH